MATFPTGIADGLHSPTTGDTVAATDVSNLVTEILALEAKVGADSSGVTTSHDYLLTHLPAQAGNWDAGAVEVRAQTFESDVVTGTAPLTIASTTVVTNLNADTVDGTHLAGLQTVLTNSAGLAAAVNDETGTGVVVFSNTPTLVTPVLGAATATSINGLTIDTTTGTLDITNAKTLTVTGDATISATPYTPGGTDVALTDGGTGASTQAGAANAVLPSQTGNANKFLESDGTNVSWATVNLASADVTGTLPVTKGGTGATAAANAASGVVVLDASSKLPAVDGSQLTGISATTAVSDTDAGTAYDDSPEVTFLTKAKTITSGKTVLLIASGYVTSSSATSSTNIKLKNGSTISQTVVVDTTGTTVQTVGWSCCAIVTGLSGSVTFSVTAQMQDSGDSGTVYGNLCVLEF